MEFFIKFNSQGIGQKKFTDLFNVLVRENYLYDGKYVFKEIHSIPMGICCSPILANVFYYMNEETIVMDEDVKSYRYTDISVVKFHGTKENLDFNNYPDGLSLKPASEIYTNINYLDINMEIKSEGLITRVCDKRKGFKFQ